MLISLLFFALSVKACYKRDKKPKFEKYKCSHGSCVDGAKKQLNGNKLCMTNYPSIELALEACDTHDCEKIAIYEFKGKDFFEILSKNSDDPACTKLPGNVKLNDPKYHKRFAVKQSATVKSSTNGLACTYGSCIENSENQPNGNKLCLMNFPSIEIATENCEIHQCDKIASYIVNGTEMFEILSKTHETNPSCATLTDEITLIDPEFQSRVRRDTSRSLECTQYGNKKCLSSSKDVPDGKRYCEVNFSSHRDAKSACDAFNCDAISSFLTHEQERRFELFNFVTTVSTECLTVGNIKRRRSKAPATNARKNSQGRNEDETRALKYPGFQSQSTNGWNKYGCAGDDKCLGPIKQYWFRQPNGNKFCFTNYPSIELAQTKCRQFNSYWAGSCTHIASYRMYTGEYRWELLNVDAQTKCAKNFDSPLIQIDAFQNQSMNQDRRPRRSAKIQTVIDVYDHNDQPFQQKQTFYPEENITEIVVDAHKEFEQNTFFLVPKMNLKISVIGNHTCILADINAYKIDDIEEEFMSERITNEANKDNTIEFEWSSGYKDSDFNLHYLPNRIAERCENKEIKELEYLFRGTKQGGSTVDAKAFILPPIEHARHARAHRVQCPANHCSQELMQAQCSPNQQCAALGRRLPSCWFAMGTTSYSTDFGQRQLVTNYYHHTNIDVACLPCCHLSSNHPKMPTCAAVLSVGDMCQWYYSNGRCPNFS